jgi:hypothetical protein
MSFNSPARSLQAADRQEKFLLTAIGALAGVSGGGALFAVLAPLVLLVVAQFDPTAGFLGLGGAAIVTLLGGGSIGAIVGGRVDIGVLQNRKSHCPK